MIRTERDINKLMLNTFLCLFSVALIDGFNLRGKSLQKTLELFEIPRKQASVINQKIGFVLVFYEKYSLNLSQKNHFST